MGMDYEGQETGARMFRILFAIPWLGKKAREFLCHHLRNSLTTVIGSVYLAKVNLAGANLGDKFSAFFVMKHLERIDQATKHILEDLKKIGC